MLKFYKVMVRHRFDDTIDKIEYHTWTPSEYNNYVQAIYDNVNKQFYHYTITRDNNNIIIDIEH